MINGLLTLRGAWDKVREDVILKFMVVAVTAYGMATFEGPLLSLKTVNAISHYTDWTIAHVHVGGLGLEWYADLWNFILAHYPGSMALNYTRRNLPIFISGWVPLELFFMPSPCTGRVSNRA